MLGAKRQATSVCPGRPLVKLIKDDALSVYESTFLKLQSDKRPPIFGQPGVVSGGVRQTRCSQDLHSCHCKSEGSSLNTQNPGAAMLSFGSSLLEGSSASKCSGQLCFHCRRFSSKRKQVSRPHLYWFLQFRTGCFSACDLSYGGLHVLGAVGIVTNATRNFVLYVRYWISMSDTIGPFVWIAIPPF
ncbi:hypothetical protein L7F22_053517 [Adiantum nelumboides]|nr:hypothetical protein [Adiantum nelumboides]